MNTRWLSIALAALVGGPGWAAAAEPRAPAAVGPVVPATSTASTARLAAQPTVVRLVPAGQSTEELPTPREKREADALPEAAQMLLPVPGVPASGFNAEAAQFDPPFRLPRLPGAELQQFFDPGAIVVEPPGAAAVQPTPPPSGEAIPTPTPRPAPTPLELAEVLRSVEQDYPLLAAVLQERGIASGDLMSAQAPWNLNLSASGISDALGFYQYNRANFALEQRTWNGAKAYAGYKLGTGFFPTWYGYQETNEGGELHAGILQPLLRDLRIDKKRAELYKARYQRALAEPVIARHRIEFLQWAAITYWDWVAAGRRYAIAAELYRIAVDRDVILAERVRLGDVAAIDQLDNRRVLVDRQAKLIAAGRKFQAEAIKLSLFFRTPDGQPAVPPPERLPLRFPAPKAPRPQRLSSDVRLAIELRPELREIRIQRQQAAVSLSLGRNQVLPDVSAGLNVAQDVGEPTPKGDKTPFQLNAGLMFDMPLQRSEARGQIRTSQSKISQLTAKERFTQDKITTEVQDRLSALVAAYQALVPARESVLLNHSLEVAERKRFEFGDSSLFIVNLRELATADAAAIEVDVVATYFTALADYRAALALDGYASPSNPGQREPAALSDDR